MHLALRGRRRGWRPASAKKGKQTALAAVEKDGTARAADLGQLTIQVAWDRTRKPPVKAPRVLTSKRKQLHVGMFGKERKRSDSSSYGHTSSSPSMSGRKANEGQSDYGSAGIEVRGSHDESYGSYPGSQVVRENRANQLNPNNPAYHSSRDEPRSTGGSGREGHSNYSGSSKSKGSHYQVHDGSPTSHTSGRNSEGSSGGLGVSGEGTSEHCSNEMGRGGHSGHAIGTRGSAYGSHSSAERQSEYPGSSGSYGGYGSR